MITSAIPPAMAGSMLLLRGTRGYHSLPRKRGQTMNDNYAVFWIFLIPVAITIPIIVWSLRYAKKRTQEFSQIAQLMGFRFLGKTWQGPTLSSLHKTSILQRIRGRYLNAMTGAVGGMDAAVFDYTYQMGKSTVTLTVVAFTHDRQLPPFELRSENIFDKMAEAFVHKDIDFDSNPEFSRRYYLRSPDDAQVRNLFTTGLLAYFEQIPSDKQWHIESSAKTLILYYRQLMKSAEVPHFLDESSEIARTILAAAH